MATALPILEIQEPGADLARKTVFIKLHLGLLGNSRKVSSSQVEVDADKELIRVAKTLLDSPELQAIRTLDGDVRRFLYDTCLPFEVGIHLLPLGLLETVDEKLNEFREKRRVLVEVFLFAYPRLCQEAAGRLRTLHNPADYPPVEEVRSRFTFTWQYVSYGVPEQLREISARMFEAERDKAVQTMAEACAEVQQVMRASLLELVSHLRDRLADQPDGKPVCTFSLAVNERWKDPAGAPRERVEWFQIVCFARLAEVCGEYLNKGRHIYRKRSVWAVSTNRE